MPIYVFIWPGFGYISDKCIILFVGKDWIRKGGHIAYETLLALEKMKINVELIICGCKPPKQYTHKNMTVVPWASVEQLRNFYEKSHFFLLPTRAECSGIVFTEASAYALPILATNTGGVPEVVIEGKNGFILPLEAKGEEYAKIISRLWRYKKTYRKMQRKTRSERSGYG